MIAFDINSNLKHDPLHLFTDTDAGFAYFVSDLNYDMFLRATRHAERMALAEVTINTKYNSVVKTRHWA